MVAVMFEFCTYILWHDFCYCMVYKISLTRLLIVRDNELNHMQWDRRDITTFKSTLQDMPRTKFQLLNLKCVMLSHKQMTESVHNHEFSVFQNHGNRFMRFQYVWFGIEIAIAIAYSTSRIHCLDLAYSTYQLLISRTFLQLSVIYTIPIVV